MDKFRAYIEEVGQKALADKLGVTKQAVNHWAMGRFQPGLTLMHRLVILSGGRLTREDIRPDIYLQTPKRREKCRSDT